MVGRRIFQKLLSYWLIQCPVEALSNHVLVSWTLLSEINGTVNYRVTGNQSMPLIPEPRQPYQFIFDRTRNRALFFGGFVGPGSRNDLWQWSVIAQEWDWIGGSLAVNNLGYAVGMGIPDLKNVPSARMQHALTINPETGVVYLFGGYSSNYADLNDFWKWDPVTTIWTWISAAETVKGIYGMFGVGNVANTPGARTVPFLFYSVNTDLVLLAFGEGHDSVGGYGFLTDVWSYNEVSHWTWIGGSQFANTPGSEELPAPGYHMAAMDTDNDCLYALEDALFDNFGSNRLWEFDLISKKWNNLGPNSGVSAIESGTWPELRTSAAFTVLDGALVLYGGHKWVSDTWLMLNDIWLWQHSTGTWMYIQENNPEILFGSSLQYDPNDQFDTIMTSNTISRDILALITKSNQLKTRSNSLWQLKIGCDYGHEWIDGQCQACPAGKSKNSSVDMNVCRNCVMNTFQSLSGQRICFTCPDPSRARCNVTGFECYPGWTVDRTKKDCVPCGDNFWKPEYGNQPCFPCPSEAETCKGVVLACQSGRKLQGIDCVPDPKLTWWQSYPGYGSLIIFLALCNLFTIGFIYGFAQREILRRLGYPQQVDEYQNFKTKTSISTTNSSAFSEYQTDTNINSLCVGTTIHGD